MKKINEFFSITKNFPIIRRIFLKFVSNFLTLLLCQINAIDIFNMLEIFKIFVILRSSRLMRILNILFLDRIQI